MRSDIIRVADEKVRSLGMDVEQMSFALDPQNQHWKAFNEVYVDAGGEPYDIKPEKADEALSPPMGQLFWAIKYDNLHPYIADGALVWVFVDVNYCKVFNSITVNRG